MLLRLSLTVLGLLCGIQAQAQDCTPYVYRSNEIVESIPEAQSFLFKVTVADTAPSYILGSFHSADAELLARWGVAAMLMAAVSPRLFISERDLQDTTGVQRQMLPAPDSLKASLADQEGLFDRVVDLMRTYGVAQNAVERFKPWFAAALLNQAAAMPRHRSDKIIDQSLYETATALGIPIKELETFADIADYYENNFSRQEQNHLLWEAVCNQDLLAALIKGQTKAFAENNVAEFYRLLNRYAAADTELSDKLTDVFVEYRNAVFWRQLWPEIQRGGVFIVVGNLHLFGTGGLLGRLGAVDENVSVLPLNPANLSFDLDPELLGNLQSWALDWAHGSGIDDIPSSVFGALRVEHQPLKVLRERLCPGQPCIIEATYEPQNNAILIADPFFARLLATTSGSRIYVDSVLLRELIRHVLYQAVAHKLDKTSTKVASAICVRATFLHWASLAQQRYLREKKSDKSARLFPLDPRCPVLEI